jgi:hypothetical protein
LVYLTELVRVVNIYYSSSKALPEPWPTVLYVLSFTLFPLILILIVAGIQTTLLYETIGIGFGITILLCYLILMLSFAIFFFAATVNEFRLSPDCFSGEGASPITPWHLFLYSVDKGIVILDTDFFGSLSGISHTCHWDHYSLKLWCHRFISNSALGFILGRLSQFYIS